MNINYIASSGNAYNLTTRIMTKTANLHVWEYEPQVTELMQGERVSSFKKPSATYQMVLVVQGSIIQRKALLTALHDDFENDVRTMQTGRLMFGDWYCDCYITSSKTEPNDKYNTWTENTITVYVPSGYWVKETSHSFSPTDSEASEFLDYPYDYQYDYTAPSTGIGTWESESPFDSDFKLEIYGPCINPRITINGYPYVVYTTVSNGKTLVIDSKNHTVMIGYENHFDDRNKVYSVFEKIPTGTLTFTWGDFDFKLTLYEERGEPRW